MDPIVAAQERFAFQYRLSRQCALMLALLACLPQVTPTIVLARLGRVETKMVILRLRLQLKGAVAIHNSRTFGYYLDADTKEFLNMI